MAFLRVRGDPHLVVVATFQHDGGPARAVSAPGGYQSTMSLRLRPLSVAVLLSRSARPLYGGMLRALALGCGAARSRPPVLGAGLGSVGGAMRVCAKPSCGTNTPP